MYRVACRACDILFFTTSGHTLLQAAGLVMARLFYIAKGVTIKSSAFPTRCLVTIVASNFKFKLEIIALCDNAYANRSGYETGK